MIQNFKTFSSLLGRAGWLWVLSATSATLLLIFVELGFAAALQWLLREFNFLSAADDFTTWPILSRISEVLEPSYLLIVIALARAVGQLVQAHGNFMIRESTMRRLRLDLIDDLLKPDGGTFEGTSITQTRLSEHFPKAANCSYFIINCFLFAIQSLGLFVALVVISWKEAFASLVGIAIIGFITQKTSKTLRKLSTAMPAAQQRLQDRLLAISRNWLLVKILRTEHAEHQRMQKEVIHYSDLSEKGTFWSNANGIFAPFLGVVMIVAILKLSTSQWGTPGTILVPFLYMMLRFIAAVTQLVNATSAFSLTLPQLSSSLEFHNRVQNRSKTQKLAVNERPHQHHSFSEPPSIDIQNMSFSFGNPPISIFTDFSLRVSSGGHLGILGTSGSGKTTLLNLMLGILSPHVGHVKIAGVSADTVFKARTIQIGYVGPDPLLLAGTVRENLTYGLDEQPKEQVLWQILQNVRLLERIQSLPNQLDTQLNEHADTLSAGQKQRLSLARALLSKPKLLILDEASSNLDENTEREIAEIISELKGQVTTVIVSHRRAFLRHADDVIDLSK